MTAGQQDFSPPHLALQLLRIRLPRSSIQDLKYFIPDVKTVLNQGIPAKELRDLYRSPNKYRMDKVIAFRLTIQRNIKLSPTQMTALSRIEGVINSVYLASDQHAAESTNRSIARLSKPCTLNPVLPSLSIYLSESSREMGPYLDELAYPRSGSDWPCWSMPLYVGWDR